VTLPKTVALALIAGALVPAGAAASTPVVAYVTSGARSAPKVWLTSGTGARARELGAGDQPLVSPNGKLVAVQRVASHGSALLIYSARAMVLARFFDISKFAATPLAWSPDSRYLAVGDVGGLTIVDTSSERATAIVRGFVAGASFAPSGPDRIVFGLSASQSPSDPVNLYRAGPNGGVTQLTRDGRSLNPVWGARGIAFDRLTRRRGNAPVYQIFLLSAGRARRITHLRVPPLLDGLVPVAVAAGGTRMLAEYVGEDTSDAMGRQPQHSPRPRAEGSWQSGDRVGDLARRRPGAGRRGRL
jgi:Tol biopolymer transport system component